MATMNVSLPEKMKTWAESRIETGLYGNVSDYVRDLIRKDQERIAYIAYIQQAVEEGLASGFSDYSPEETWKRLKSGRG